MENKFYESIMDEKTLKEDVIRDTPLQRFAPPPPQKKKKKKKNVFERNIDIQNDLGFQLLAVRRKPKFVTSGVTSDTFVLKILAEMCLT